MIVAFFVLLVAFGSALTAGLPLLTALIGVAIGLSFDHGADERRRDQLDRPHARAHAGPGGGDRLCRVHHLPAVVGFLFTIGAALGAVVWIFQQGHLADLLAVQTTSPIVRFLPTLMIAILFGLAMDYEVFLVSRMREGFVHTENALGSVVGGFQASARVVTAAGLIMIAVFSGFVLSDDVVIRSIGFALGVAAPEPAHA